MLDENPVAIGAAVTCPGKGLHLVQTKQAGPFGP